MILKSANDTLRNPQELSASAHEERSFSGIQSKSVEITNKLRNELGLLRELIEDSKSKIDSRSQWRGILNSQFRF